MNAKRVLRTLNYLPRWAWYLLSLLAGNLVGILAVYLVFHALEKMAKDQDAEDNIDADYTVTSDEETERRWQRTEASAAHAQAQPASEEGAEDVAALVRSGEAAMRRIRQANDIIADEALSAHIDSIESSCAQILAILRQRPQLLPQLRTFLRYYLPTTLRLLEARAKLENTASTPKAQAVRARISEAVTQIDGAFAKQVEALDEYRFLDLESEMDVLRDMLKADGLIDETPDDDPFAAVLGGH